MNAHGLIRAAILAAIAAVTHPAIAIAQDQPVIFAHGLRNDHTIWNYLAPSLRNLFRIQPVTPTLNSQRPYGEQATNLAVALGSATGVPAVSYSNGGVVVREYIRQQGIGARINRHVSVASPHTGAQLATSYSSGAIWAWFAGTAAIISGALDYYKNNDEDWWLSGLASSTIVVAGYGLAGLFSGFGLGIDPLGLRPEFGPVLHQMESGSLFLGTLNSTASRQNEAARTTARVSIATRVHPIFVPEGLVSASDELRIVRFALMDFAAVMYYYYDGHWDVFLQANKYRWANMWWRLYDLTAAWQDFIGARLTYHRLYWDWISNDGVVHWFDTRYPGATRTIEEPTQQINHLEIPGAPRVLNLLEDVLEDDFSILRRTGPPPPPPPPPPPGPGPFTAVIAGPTAISPVAVCSWAAGTTGAGSAPYAYEWWRGGSLVGTSSDYTAGMDGASSFTLLLRVTDGGGQTDTDEITVTNTGEGECLLAD